MTNSSPKVTLPVDELVQRLAPMLGEEQAWTMVRRSLKALGFREGSLSRAQQRGVLSWLGCQEGLVALAARHLLRSLDPEAGLPEAPTSERMSLREETPRSSLTSSSVTPIGDSVMVARDELVSILARALGDQKALEVVTEASTKLRIGGAWFSLRATHAILELLASEPGIVGVTARFAKARFAMRSA